MFIRWERSSFTRILSNIDDEDDNNNMDGAIFMYLKILWFEMELHLIGTILLLEEEEENYPTAMLITEW